MLSFRTRSRSGEATTPQRDPLPPRRSAEAPHGRVPAGMASLRGLVDLAGIAAGLIEAPLGRRSRKRRWIVREAGPDLEVLRVTRGVPETLARVGDADADADGSASWRREFAAAEIVELRLDPETIVRQRFALPAESRPFAAAIIEHRLDRLTPWKADDVVYGYAVRPGAGRDDPIEIDFAATSRDIATRALKRLARLGRAPTAMGSAADPVGEPPSVDLLAGSAGERPTRRRRILRDLCLAGLPLSVAAFLGTALWSALAQADLDTASTALDLQRRAVQARSANGEPGQAIASFLAAKTLDGATFALIDRLAGTIPDGTFLTDIEISETAVRLKGRSANAPALVPILEGESGLADVRFESPVIREANGGDRFDIVATREAVRPSAEVARP